MGFPFEIITMLGSTLLSSLLSIWAQSRKAKAEEQPQIKELSATPSNRDVRVNDGILSPAPDCAQYSFATAQSILSKACKF